MENNITRKGEWAVWKVEGRIDVTTAEGVYEEGDKIVEQEEKTALDMSGIDYISSAGLRVLLRLWKKAKKQGKAFTVVGAGDAVKMVLEDSNMDTLLEARESVDEL
ncbi:MAG: STAS domain-containing protein [Schwartzia sp.]|nr:STAS domain-containing protein [Schwartzia sp. (in: firmicutes)]